MGQESVLNDLLSAWQRRREQGQDVAAADLCRDRPELVPELERLIEALRRMNRLAQPDTSVEAGGGSPPAPREPHVAPSTVVSAETPSRPALPAGAPQVPGYEILGELGRGGMGVVYRARQTSLNRLVALKMILAGGYAGEAELMRFRTEAEAIARLQHANIVQIHEVGEADGRPFFSLEYCGGGSLDRRLNGTPLPAPEAARLGETLARAMDAAHRAGVVHRDLKPANILLSSGGCQPPDEVQGSGGLRPPLADCTPKISDFGLAKRLDDAGQTTSGAILGTPSYMAPEQAEGRTREVGPATDVYALGALLYELLTGRPPFRAATPLETLRQVAADEPVSPRRLQPQTPHDLETVCLTCLHKDPRRRYASALALADDLRRFRAGEPVAARPVGPVGRGWRWCRRNPVTAALLGAVAAALVGGTAVASYFAYDARRQAGEAFRARGRAEQKEQEARAEGARAQNNLQEALASIDQMLTHVGERRLQHVPQFDRERRSILQDALKLQQRLLDQNSTEPSARLETAKAHVRVGDIDYFLGEDRSAEQAYRESIRLLEALTADYPGGPAYQAALAQSHHQLAFLLLTTAAGPEGAARAEEHFAEALRLRDGLVRAHPDDRDAQALLAKEHYIIAQFYRDQGKPREAEDSFQQTVRLQLRLLRSPAASAEEQGTLASIYNSMGYFYQVTSQWAQAEAAYDEGRRLFEQLVAARPTDLHFLEEQAFVAGSLGLVYENTQRLEQYRRGARLYEPLARSHPTFPVYMQELARDYVNLAGLLRRKGRTAEALGCDTRAVRLLRAGLEKVPDDKEMAELLQRAYAGRTEALGLLPREVKDVEAYRQAAAGQEALAAEFPAVLDYAVDAAAVSCGLGRLLREKGRPKDALAWYAKAIATLEGALTRDTAQHPVRKGLRDAYAGRAEALAALRPQAEAADDWIRAVQLDDGGGRSTLQLQRAFTYARGGTPARALEDMEGVLGREKDPSPSLLSDLARVCALAAGAARDDPPAAQRYAARGVDSAAARTSRTYCAS
jgi:serine/threonine protein kinase